MSEQEHHHHHHSHKKDSATVFKERSLQAIANRKVIEKTIKTVLVIIAVLMAIAVVVAYKFL
jgi:hypothetical protein